LSEYLGSWVTHLRRHGLDPRLPSAVAELFNSPI
jgi:hypothetical protein